MKEILFLMMFMGVCWSWLRLFNMEVSLCLCVGVCCEEVKWEGNEEWRVG